jgi:hypothetical protein
MRKFHRHLLWALTILVSVLACKSDEQIKQVSLGDISWLEGQWQTEPRSRVEVWSRKGNKYQASGLILNGNNPRVNELMNISVVDGILVYSVLAYGQNDNKYVDFSLSNLKPTDLIFTNPDHDFPKIIRYTLQNEDQLKVSVGDNSSEQLFTFYRSR